MKPFPNKCAILLFGISLLIGLSVYRDYGVAIDEEPQRQVGEATWKYLNKDYEALRTFHDKDYGVAFELPLYAFEKLLNLSDPRQVYFMRHLSTHLFFLVSAFFFFLLIKSLYGSDLVAGTGYIFLVLNPRIYAHSFFNSKDLPFMSMFIICLSLCALAFQKKRAREYVILGISCGILMNMRMPGIMLTALILMFSTIDYVFALQAKKDHGKILFNSLLFFVVSFSTLILFWPYLWENPVGNYLDAFRNMSKFRWNGDVLYFGQFVRSTNLSWSYLPVWFSTTTPILYLLLGISGIVLLLDQFLKRPLDYIRNTKERNHLLFAICFFLPVIATILLRSVLYDGWRQLYFVYPAFILLAMHALHALMKSRSRRFLTCFLACGGAYILLVLGFMMKHHTYEQVYFNELIPRKKEFVRKAFEMDYWGASYINGLKHIANNDPGGEIRIKIENGRGQSLIEILPKKDRDRIVLVDNITDADYFMTNYRWHPEDYDLDSKVFEIRALNSAIISVWQLNP